MRRADEPPARRGPRAPLQISLWAALASMVAMFGHAQLGHTQRGHNAQPPRTVVHTVEVVNADAAVYLAPRPDGGRRGTLALGARFTPLARVRGEGCEGEWVSVADGAWVCGRHVRTVAAPPHRPTVPTLEAGKHLPYDYAFVRFDGTRAFIHPRDADVDEYFTALGDGFGIVITGFERYGGHRWARTRRGLYVDADAIGMAHGSDFVGVALRASGASQPASASARDSAASASARDSAASASARDSAAHDSAVAGVRIEAVARREDGLLALPVAWVRRPGATVHARRGGPVARRAGGRELVRVVRTERGWAELEGGEWIQVARLHLARPTRRPSEVPEGGTWIDVDVRAQTLVFWRGESPEYATLTSTGRAGPSATPPGVHRIWVKLAFSDMDDLQRVDAERNYAIEQVPWVQYFERGNGIHAAFWHDDFGRRRSHGCVNLSPADARALYELTEPAVPPGWTAIFPREGEPTTYVQVRN